MTSTQPDRPPAVSVAIDPQADTEVREFVSDQAAAGMLRPSSAPAVEVVGPSVVGPVAATVAAAAAAGIVIPILAGEEEVDAGPGSITQHAQDVASAATTAVSIVLVLLFLAVAGWLAWRWRAVQQWRRAEADDHQLFAKAAGHYVLPEQLTEADRAMLGRAQAAADAVLSSAVHCTDVIDSRRNAVMLPAQVWAVAEALAEHSRLAQAAPAESAGPRLADETDVRAAALATARQGIERRVAGLETYAEQVAEADARFAEWRQAQQLTADSDDVLTLVARTTSDELSAAEVAFLVGQAASAAAQFERAASAARDVGARVLPSEGNAA
ncbi:hypothetical protein [Kitasatospora sp. NPDC057541]|uniref:hypothetical protein n=1 Tax=unclassified Kitasatospora TaxID=2633591 RepID=UPI003673DC3D